MKNSSLLARNFLLTAFLAITLAACSLSSSTPTSTPAATATKPPAPTPTAPPFPPTFVEIARLGVGRRGPAAISPSGDRIAIPTAIGILIYSAETQEFLTTLEVPKELFTYAAWSPSGDQLASASQTGIIYIWSADKLDDETKFETKFSGSAGALIWSPDGSKLAADTINGPGQVWDTSTWEPVFKFSTGNRWYISPNPVWSPDSQSLLIYRDHKAISILKAPDDMTIMTIEVDPFSISAIGVSPDTSLLSYVDESENFIIWNIQDAREVNVIAAISDDAVTSFSWSPDSSKIAASYSDNSVSILDVATGEQTSSFDGYPSSISGIKWFPDSEKILIFSSEDPPLIWEAGITAELPLPPGHIGLVNSLGWSPDDSVLGTASAQGILWDTSDWKSKQEIGVPDLSFLLWSPDLSQHIIRGHHTAYQHWDTMIGELIGILAEEYLSSIQWSRDDQKLIWVDNNSVGFLWDRETKLTIEIPNWPIGRSVALSADGSKLALAKKNTIQILDMSTKFITSLQPIDPESLRQLAWSHDGNLLAIYSSFFVSFDDPSDKEIIIRDINTKNIIATLENQALIGYLPWSPDGKLLLTLNPDGDIEIWDTSTWQITQTIPVNNAGVRTLAWSHSGTMIAIGGRDGVVRIRGVQKE